MPDMDILSPNGSGGIGPGLPINITFSSPPAGNNVRIVASSLVDPFNNGWSERINVGGFSTNMFLRLGTGIDLGIANLTTHADDQSVQVIAGVYNNNVSIEQVVKTMHWDSQSGVPWLVQHQTQTGGGLTTAQAAQLTQTETNTNQQQTDWANYTAVTLPSLQTVLDGITTGITSTIGTGLGAVQKTIGEIFTGRSMEELTEGDLGTACFPSVISSTLPIGGSAYGLQIQVTSYPAWVVFTGLDEHITEQPMAVVELARSGNIVYRRTLHQLSDLIYPLPGVPTLPIGLELPIDPGNYSLTITPGLDVCVAAQLLGFP